MAITYTVAPAVETTRMTSISHLDDAGSPAAAAYDIGYTPRYIKVDNVTDRISYEWYTGMTSDYAVKTVAAGTRTLETSGGITVTSGDNIGFAVIQSKQYRVIAIG